MQPMRPFLQNHPGWRPRFPRMMRDLSLQHHKPVNLVIEGETNLKFDQVAVEALTDPPSPTSLRNAFDHGIEPPRSAWRG